MKKGAACRPARAVIREGGVRQEWHRLREEERTVQGSGIGTVIRWEKRAIINYTRCRTGKGNLRVESTLCRGCGRFEETGAHVALVCLENEKLGRHFGSWEQADDPNQVFKTIHKGDKMVTVDLAETFFGSLWDI